MSTYAKSIDVEVPARTAYDQWHTVTRGRCPSSRRQVTDDGPV